ncbi:MAG TPA: SLC13 family permease [Gammaproteobacteria bacterium]|nr:SLC13 family permease [Gammaproteobacteria bacterium]
MTVEIALVFLVIAGALYLFASQRLPLDVTALLILVTVMAIPVLFHSQWLLDRGVDLQAAFPTVQEGLSGLSSTATVTVLCMFILSAGIERSGLVHVLGKRLFPLVGQSELRQILIIALLVGPVSGFINNTAAVAIAIPLVLDMARRGGSKASRLLMPVSFFAMLGGTLTLIGTSTNILASAILEDDPAFGREIGMFEFTHLGLIVLAVGLVYFVTVGRWLMPKKDAAPLAHDEEERYVVELGVPPKSALVGRTLADWKFLEKTGVDVLKLVRGDSAHIKRAENMKIAAGDVILVRGTLRQIMDLVKADEVEVLSEFGDARRVRGDGLFGAVLLRNRRVFAGRTAAVADFWSRYRARLIGLDTQKLQSNRLASEILHVGEVVLVEMSKAAFARLQRHPDVVVLTEFEDDFDRRNMWIAGGIIAGVVMAAAFTPLPIVATAIAGVIVMVISGCIAKEDLYSGVSWDVIFLLAGVIPLGIAMTKSGAAAWLGGLLVMHAVDWHPVVVLIVIYAVTTLLTEVVSNNAAAVILVPVAISIAQALAIEPFALVLAVMFAASTSFLSPIGYQTNTMIFGTGVYRFSDFAKVGAPLNILLMLVTSFAIWRLWLVQAPVA